MSEALSPVLGRDDGHRVLGIFDDLFTKLLQLVHRRHDTEEEKERKGEDKRERRERGTGIPSGETSRTIYTTSCGDKCTLRMIYEGKLSLTLHSVSAGA